MRVPTILALLLLSFCHPAWAEGGNDLDKVLGHWLGTLEVSGQKLRLAVHISKEKEAYKATLDSLDQGAKGLAIDEISMTGHDFQFSMKAVRASYKGVSNKDHTAIKGTWLQNMRAFPLVFKRTKTAARLKRPQEPKKPYPYQEETVEFSHDPAKSVMNSFEPRGTRSKSQRVTLQGTLTLPRGKGPFTTVVLVSGSGPQDRNEQLLGHKPFLILADHLSRLGMAVLRFDDRGVGQSTGDFKKATTRDFADDALAAVQYLKTRKEVDSAKIGVMGHSEGGLIAPMVAVDDPQVAFIVMLAGPGVKGSEVLARQTYLINRSAGMSEKDSRKSQRYNEALYKALSNKEWREEKRLAEAKKILLEALGELTAEQRQGIPNIEAFADAQLRRVTSPWFRFFLDFDPAPTLRKVKCPVLALNGAKDVQVDAGQNLPAIVRALEDGKNEDYAAIKLPRLNHLFQRCKTGAFSEYAQIEETFAPFALKTVSDWILTRPKRALVKKALAKKEPRLY